MEAGNAARSPEFKQQSIDVKEVALLRHQLAEARLEIDELAAAADEALGDSEVSFLLCTVTFYANLADSLTRSP